MSSLMPNGTPAASDPAGQQPSTMTNTLNPSNDTTSTLTGQPAASQSDPEASTPQGEQSPAAEVVNPAAQKAAQEAAKYRTELRAAQQRLAEYETAQRAAEEAQLSELEKAQRRIAEYQTQEAQWQLERQQWRVAQAVQMHAARLGIVDVDAAQKLLDTSALDYDENGVPTNAEALLTAMLAQRPWLRGASPTNAPATPPAAAVGATNPQRVSGPITISATQYSDSTFRTQFMRDFGEDILTALNSGRAKLI